MNELQNLEELLNALLNGIQEVLQSGEILSDEFQMLLAQELEYLTTRIDELQQQAPLPTAVPQLDPGPFPSSNVNSFKYDPDKQQLFVKFHGENSADSGPIYSYQGVPQYIFNVFSQGGIGPKTSGQNQYHRWIKGVTPSLGGTMNALIKAGGFPYQRVS